MMATVNSIAGMELSGKASWAGVPGAVFLLAGAAGALAWGILMERAGRRGVCCSVWHPRRAAC